MTPQDTGLLRIMTCGSVDDGKSTLIGRLLYECKVVPDDGLAALAADSRKYGSAAGNLDLALLVDGLLAEREQGITIDVAYRYFATPRRKFIIADTPGHEQYTRNMATGASVSDVAIVLVDARKGITDQTRRHCAIVAMFGLDQVVLAINKMDLVDFSQARFEEITREFQTLAARLGLGAAVSIPIVARDGDTVIERSLRLGWYAGPPLLEHLEAIKIAETVAGPLRMPVQWVNRPNHDFRGHSGSLTSGRVRVGDGIVVLPSGTRSRIAKLLCGDVEVDECVAGDAATFVLTDEIDIGRGDVISAHGSEPDIGDGFVARLLWTGDEAMRVGGSYLIKCATQTTVATITALKGKLSLATFEIEAGRELRLNEIGLCAISTARPIVIAPFARERDLGAFILIDKLTNATVAAGLISHDVRLASNVSWQALDVDKAVRAKLKAQRPCCLWFTGLSGAGKSTIANLVEKRLTALGRHTYLLDGDNVRHGLNRDLGFTDADRAENIRRVSEVAKLMVDAGLIVLVAFISPFRAERRMARELFAEGEFVEIFVDAPLALCEQRDPKGLYRKARQGKLPNFTGIDSAYEPPEEPEIRLATGESSPEPVVDSVLAYLAKNKCL